MTGLTRKETIMTMKKTVTAVTFAAAAAALFSTAALTSMSVQAGDNAVKCSGVNSCKGTSDCATASSACKGQNACKGQGWSYTASAESCAGEGGTVVEG